MSANEALFKRIEELTGNQRYATFKAAAEFIIKHGSVQLVETGCYRGNNGDGHSTLVLALIADAYDGVLTSYELSEDHIIKAQKLLSENNAASPVDFVCGDSVEQLSLRRTWVDFAYLDSFDHDPNNPLPCQLHQLAELGAIYGKMTAPCAILMDDNVSETGGKVKLARQFLIDRGWTLAVDAYQLLFTKE